jgi:hypothetical protein
MRTAFDEIATELKGPRTPLEKDASRALKSVEEAARQIGPIVGDPVRGYLALLARVLEAPAGGEGGEASSAGGLVLP